MDTPAHEAAAGAAYDALAQRYVDFAPEHYSGHTLGRSLMPAFADLVEPGLPVADLGCGPGHVAAHLHTLGLEVVGLDLSGALLDHARATHPHPRFVRARMGRLPLASGRLGGIVAHYSLIHTPPRDLPGTFAEWGRALAPGGVVLASFHTRDDGGDPEPFDHKVAPAHRHTVDGLLHAARPAGFTEIARLIVAGSQDALRGWPQGHLMMHRGR